MQARVHISVCGTKDRQDKTRQDKTRGGNPTELAVAAQKCAPESGIWAAQPKIRSIFGPGPGRSRWTRAGGASGAKTGLKWAVSGPEFGQCCLCSVLPYPSSTSKWRGKLGHTLLTPLGTHFSWLLWGRSRSAIFGAATRILVGCWKPFLEGFFGYMSDQVGGGVPGVIMGETTCHQQTTVPFVFQTHLHNTKTYCLGSGVAPQTPIPPYPRGVYEGCRVHGLGYG